jgi:hypothetical protein
MKARRAKKDDGVLDALAPEPGQRFLVFGEDAKNAAIAAVEKLLVLVGQRRAIMTVLFVFFVRHAIVVRSMRTWDECIMAVLELLSPGGARLSGVHES